MSTFSLNAHVAVVLFNKTPVHEKQDNKEKEKKREKKKEKKKENEKRHRRKKRKRGFLNTFLCCEDAIIDVLTTAPSYLW